MDENKRRPLTPMPTINEIKEHKTFKIKKMEHSVIFLDTLERLKQDIVNIELNVVSIALILKKSMELVEDLGEIRGTEQKPFAISLVRELISRSDIDQDIKISCISVIEMGVLDNVVDIVVDATKGKINVNKLKKKVFFCC